MPIRPHPLKLPIFTFVHFRPQNPLPGVGKIMSICGDVWVISLKMQFFARPLSTCG